MIKIEIRNEPDMPIQAWVGDKHVYTYYSPIILGVPLPLTVDRSTMATAPPENWPQSGILRILTALQDSAISYYYGKDNMRMLCTSHPTVRVQAVRILRRSCCRILKWREPIGSFSYIIPHDFYGILPWFVVPGPFQYLTVLSMHRF